MTEYNWRPAACRYPRETATTPRRRLGSQRARKHSPPIGKPQCISVSQESGGSLIFQIAVTTGGCFWHRGFGRAIIKDRGLAVLVGVGRCHEMGIGEGLVKRLAIEATLDALLLFLLQFTDLRLKSLAFFLLTH